MGMEKPEKWFTGIYENIIKCYSQLGANATKL